MGATKNFFSGIEGNQHYAAAVGAGAKHVLTSFLYIRERGIWDYVSERKKKNPKMRFLIDSGAHTIITNKKVYKLWSTVDWEKYIQEYVDWIRENKKYIFACVELDIDFIVGTTLVERWQKQYFEPLLKEGIDVVFCWHTERGMEGWEEMCSRYPYVGLPGEMSSDADFNKYMAVAKRYTTKVHGFAASVTGDTKLLLRDKEDRSNVIELTIEQFFNMSNPSSITEIDEWRVPDGDWECWTLSNSLKNSFEAISRVVKHTLDKKIYRVTLRGGKQLKVTGDHSLFALDYVGRLVEVKPENLAPGDHLVSSLLSEDLVDAVTSTKPNNIYYEFLGFYIGDGHVSKTEYHIWVSKQHQSEIRDLCQKFASLINASLSEVIDETVDAFISSSRHAKHIAARWGRVGPEKTLSPLFDVNNENLSSFLRGYFSADGTAKGANRLISLSSVHRELLEQVQLLLERFDIRSGITDAGVSGKGSHTWELSISDYESRCIFANKIGFLQKDQNDALNKKNFEQIGVVGCHRGLPVSLLKRKTHYTSDGKKYRPVGDVKRTTTKYDNFTNILQEMEAEYLEIASIDVVSEGGVPVYDLEVPSVQRFYANGILAHNTKQADFRDWPWYSIDSITWKTGEMYGILFYWDTANQKFKMISADPGQDKSVKREPFRRMFEAEGYDADGIIQDTQYKEVTRWNLYQMRLMEEFYADLNKRKVQYWELRLPHPVVVKSRMSEKRLLSFWKKFRPEDTFKAHAEENSPNAIRHFVCALACVQYRDLSECTKEGKLFLEAYFKSQLEATDIDYPSWQKELAIRTAPRNPRALKRVDHSHYLAQNNPPKRREKDLYPISELLDDPNDYTYDLHDLLEPYELEALVGYTPESALKELTSKKLNLVKSHEK